MNILIIGDIMLDVNFISKIERNAPEANIPIYKVEEQNDILGGAANVAQNLNYLKCNIELISVVGDDNSATHMKALLRTKQIPHTLFVDETRNTTQKNRVFVNNQLVTRYDIEDNHNIRQEFENKIINHVENIITEYNLKGEKIDAIVISDYNKGVITPTLCEKIIHYCIDNNIYTFVDPKTTNIEKYKNCFCFKPNLTEGEMISKEKEIDNILTKIQNTLNPNHVILTCGSKGIYVDNIKNHLYHKNTFDVVDVTGAGDIVLCVLVYVFLQKKDMLLAAEIANHIAGKSVTKVGNYNISLEDISESYEIIETQNTVINDKIINDKIINDKIIFDYEIEKIKALSKQPNLVFTNGCFDIIHSAHIQNLQFAKMQGECLVVGLNSDSSVKRIKGEERPINNEEERSKLLSLFDFVDYVIIFNDDTPLSVLQLLCPAILVKGSDYKKEDIIGSEYAQRVLLFDYIDGKSSSRVINKIQTIANK